MSPHADRMNDADNHYYEPDDCFTRHIEAAYVKRTYRVDRLEPGVPARMLLGDERCHFFSVGVGDSVGAPGMMKEFLRGTSADGGSPSLNPIFGLGVPEFVEKSARLAKMDEQGIERYHEYMASMEPRIRNRLPVAPYGATATGSASA